MSTNLKEETRLENWAAAIGADLNEAKTACQDLQRRGLLSDDPGMNGAGDIFARLLRDIYDPGGVFRSHPRARLRCARSAHSRG